MAIADTRPAGFSPVDAARQLSISRTSLYRLIRRGDLRTVKIGAGRTVIPTSEIDRLLALPDLVGE